MIPGAPRMVDHGGRHRAAASRVLPAALLRFMLVDRDPDQGWDHHLAGVRAVAVVRRVDGVAVIDANGISSRRITPSPIRVRRSKEEQRWRP